MRTESLWGKAQQARSALLQKKGALKRIIAILIAVCIFAFVGLSLYQSWDELSAYKWQINYFSFLLALAVQIVTIVIAFLGWHLILRRVGGPIGLRRNARSYFYAAAAKYIPGTLWYIAGRMYLFEKEAITKTAILTGSALEMMVLWISGVIAYLLLLPFYSYTVLPLNTSASLTLVFLLTCLILIVVVVRPSLFVEALNLILERIKRRRVQAEIQRKDILMWLAVYFLAWLLGGVAFYGVVGSIYPLAAAELPTIIGFSTLFALLGLITPFLPGSIGVRDVSAALLLSYYVPFSVGVVIALMFRACTIVADLLLAIFSRVL